MYGDGRVTECRVLDTDSDVDLDIESRIRQLPYNAALESYSGKQLGLITRPTENLKVTVHLQLLKGVVLMP